MKYLFLISLLIVTFSDAATTPPVSLPPPIGLTACREGDNLQLYLESLAHRMASSLNGCYLSERTVQFNSGSNAIEVPRDYAYALTVDRSDGNQFTANDFEALKKTVKEQWAKFQPKDGLQSREYQEKINALLASIIQEENSAEVTVKTMINAPVSLSIDESVANQYIVTSIRKRKVQLESGSYYSVAIDSSGVLFKNGQLIRISFVRELRGENDVQFTKEMERSWISAIRSSQ